MKRMFLIGLFGLLGAMGIAGDNCTMAQGVEELVPDTIKTDAMLGRKGGVAWRSNHVMIYEPEGSSTRLTMVREDHIFVKNSNTRIGFYTSNDSLIGMAMAARPDISQDGLRMDMTVFFANDSVPYSEYSEKGWAMPKSWRVRMSDVMRFLRETDGYIRFVTTTYGGYLYDVKFRLRREE